MKIVQINCVYGTASTGRIVKGIEECARENGMECMAAYSQGMADDIQAFRFGGAMGQKVHALLSRVTGLQGYFSHFATRKLLKKLDEVKPDIVHLHNLHSNNINLKMLLAYLAKNDIATVLTLHDCWFFTGNCCYFTLAGCENWKDTCGNCPSLKEDNKSLFFDQTRRSILDKRNWFGKIPRLAVIGVSDWITDLAKASVVLGKASRFQTIHNGIDLKAFVPRDSDLKQQLGLDGQFVVLGLAMGMSRRKGYYDFLKLVKILPQGITIVLAGLTKEQIANLPKGIVGIEQTHDVSKLAEIYSMADVLVTPTYEDNFPTVNMEALACGTPVITYRTGGSPESLDETCGIVVDCGDIEAMKNAIVRIKEQPFSQQACVERVQQFCKRKRYLDYINLYRELVE